MGCKFINDKVAGRILLPDCIGVAVSNDIEDCTCYKYNKARYTAEEMVKVLRAENKELKQRIKVLSARCNNETN